MGPKKRKAKRKNQTSSCKRVLLSKQSLVAHSKTQPEDETSNSQNVPGPSHSYILPGSVLSNSELSGKVTSPDQTDSHSKFDDFSKCNTDSPSSEASTIIHSPKGLEGSHPDDDILDPSKSELSNSTNNTDQTDSLNKSDECDFYQYYIGSPSSEASTVIHSPKKLEDYDFGGDILSWSPPRRVICNKSSIGEDEEFENSKQTWSPSSEASTIIRDPEELQDLDAVEDVGNLYDEEIAALSSVNQALNHPQTSDKSALPKFLQCPNDDPYANFYRAFLFSPVEITGPDFDSDLECDEERVEERKKRIALKFKEKKHEITLKYDYKEVKCTLFTYEPIRNLLEFLFETEAFPLDTMVPHFNDKKIGPLDTPYYLNFGDNESIDVFTLPPKDYFWYHNYVEVENQIIVHVQNGKFRQKKDKIRINSEHPLYILYALYAAIHRVEVNKIILNFDGDELKHHLTAKDMKIINDDTIDACVL